MKLTRLILSFLLLCGSLIAEDFLSGGVFVKRATNQATLNLVGQSQTVSNEIVAGKTYISGDNMLEFITKAGILDLQLSSGTQVRVLPSTEFRVDAFNQMVQNSEGEPEVVKYNDYILNMALMSGECFIASPSYISPNTMCILQTPLTNLELNGGKYLIKASQKFVIAYVVEGKIAVLDSKTNKKEEVKQGQMALVVPFPGGTGLLTTSKGIEPGELLKHINTIKELEFSRDSVMFAVINRKIVGVKLR